MGERNAVLRLKIFPPRSPLHSQAQVRSGAVLLHEGHAHVVAAALDALQAVVRCPGREAALAGVPAVLARAALILLDLRVLERGKAARPLDVSARNGW